MFDTVELQVLVGIRSGKTLSQIGGELLLSHPSVSKTLRAAEQKAGLKLAELDGRRLRLTPDGERLAAAAQEALVKLREIDSMLTSTRAGEGGALGIVASGTVCSYVLPAVVGKLLEGVHDVDLRIQSVDAGVDIWTLFDSGAYDVAISWNVPPPHVSATHLFDDELCICVAAGSDLARQPDIDWHDLSGQTLIGPPADNPMWRQFSLLGIRPRSRVQVSSAALAKRLVQEGKAIALQYHIVAAEEVAKGELAMLPLPDTPMTLSYWLAIRSGSAGLPLVQSFVRLLRSHVRELDRNGQPASEPFAVRGAR